MNSVVETPGIFNDVCAKSEWIAGHISRPRFSDALKAADRRVEFVTALRDPVAQVRSHYNWLIEIGRRGRAFLESHPPNIIEIHRRIAGSDNSNPDTIVANMKMNEGLFMNCQAQFVIGPDYGNAAVSYLDRLGVYSAIVFSDDIAGGLEPILGKRPSEMPRENASPYHLDPSIFQEPEIQTYLLDRNRFDFMLWALANRMRGGPK